MGNGEGASTADVVPAPGAAVPAERAEEEEEEEEEVSHGV